MRALFKMKKKSIKVSASDLVRLANEKLGNGFLYIRAPYSMGTDEFLIHYGKYFFILPSEPTREDLIEGIYSPTGARMVSFFKQ